jgi:hypothetical protein
MDDKKMIDDILRDAWSGKLSEFQTITRLSHLPIDTAADLVGVAPATFER